MLKLKCTIVALLCVTNFFSCKEKTSVPMIFKPPMWIHGTWLQANEDGTLKRYSLTGELSGFAMLFTRDNISMKVKKEENSYSALYQGSQVMESYSDSTYVINIFVGNSMIRQDSFVKKNSILFQFHQGNSSYWVK